MKANDYPVKSLAASVFFWGGGLLSAVSWFAYSGFYEHPSIVAGATLQVIAVALLTHGGGEFLVFRRVAERVFLSFLLLLGAVLTRFPHNAGLVLMLLYVLGSEKIPYMRRLLSPAVVLVTQSLLFYVIWAVAPQQHEIPVVQPQVYWVIRLLGADASLFNGRIYLSDQGYTTCFLAGCEHLGVHVLVIFAGTAVAAYFCGLVRATDARKAGLAVLAVIGYAVLRYIGFVLAYVYYRDVRVMVNSALLSVTLIPVSVIAGTFLRPVTTVSREKQLSEELRMASIFGVVVFAVALLLAVEDPGTKKDGRVLVDEYHSAGWESATQELDTQSFGGQKSVYTYYSLVKWLKNFYEVRLGTDSTVCEDLDDYDILIVKTPTRPFSPKEIDQITAFVKEGGGLWLIGDHTNLFNMSGHLNSICGQWGIQFAYDVTYDLRTTGLTQYVPSFLFPHVIVQGLEAYKFASSCSLRTAPQVRSVMIGRGLCSEQMDLSSVHFFGNMVPEPEDRLGLFIQCAARKVGKGRVVAYTDSTTFSSFSVFMHDNPEFVLATLAYLNRRNSVGWALLSIGCSILLVLSAVAIWTKCRSRLATCPHLIATLCVTSVMLSLANSSAALANRLGYINEVVEQLDSVPTVFFDMGHSSIRLPHFIGLPPTENDFSHFFIDFQRLGYFNRETGSVRKCLKGNPLAIVVVEPTRPFTQDEKNGLQRYVKGGGKIILCDSALNKKSTAHQLLSVFGIYVQRPLLRTVPVVAENGAPFVVVPTVEYAPARNGERWQSVVSEHVENMYLIAKEYGRGTVCVLGDSALFGNKFLGDPGVPPTRFQYDLHQELFRLIESAMAGVSGPVMGARTD